MSAPLPADTIVKPLLDDQTISDIENSIKCEWTEGGEQVCAQVAKWIFIMRKFCAHGGVIPPPYIYFLCDEHRDLYLRYLSPKSGYACVACVCPIDGPHHLVDRITHL